MDPLTVYYLAVISSLSTRYLFFIYPLSGYYLTVICLLSSHYLLIICQLSGYYPLPVKYISVHDLFINETKHNKIKTKYNLGQPNQKTKTNQTIPNQT
jgi:hypothetical protein